MPSKTIRKIATFLALTLAFSSIFYYLILSSGSMAAEGGLYVLGLMWSPGLAGMLTQFIYERTLRGLGWKLGPFKYLAAAYLLPLGYALVIYGITWLTGLGGFPAPEMMAQIDQQLGGITRSPALQILLAGVVTALVGLIGGLASGVGEEIGWRGLFVPELNKVTGFTRAALISGAVWALWHLPGIFFVDYNLAGAPRWYAALMFTTAITSLSFAFAWLRLKSGSLWPAAVLHAMHNLFIQIIFTPLTVQNEITPYIIDEFGIGLALAGVAVALYFWSRRKELPQAQPYGAQA